MRTLHVTTVQQWKAAGEQLRSERYGVIEVATARLVAIHLRRFPKLVAWPELWPTGSRYHARTLTDRCLLYYNQPRSCPNFLALKYVVSGLHSTYATLRATLTVLDAIAELKRCDAVLCDASNRRISDRLLTRLGWQPHKPQRWHRNYIKRFYGEYPPVSLPLANPQASLPAPGCIPIACDIAPHRCC